MFGDRDEPKGDLARELEDLIHNLDRIDEATRPPTPGSSAETEASSSESGTPVRNGQMVSETAQTFQDEVLDHLNELARSMRTLSNVIRVNQAELLNELLRTEQSLLDEINQAEKRLRGDVAALRWDLATGNEQDDSGGESAPPHRS